MQTHLPTVAAFRSAAVSITVNLMRDAPSHWCNLCPRLRVEQAMYEVPGDVTGISSARLRWNPPGKRSWANTSDLM
jgi:hypothetical protein